ncbi:MAG: VTT domain-containing protein [Candidatus Yanofskybacteria bacterium]|nr:VTT domain-containing protein [Candidatus Yanofskybacteria bacterium]
MEQLLGIDLVSLIKAVGYIGLFAIIFAESGLFVGFFLPGDSLLFTAGFLASQGYLHIVPLALLTFAAAVLGDNFGYAFGKKVGIKIFNREDSIFFHKDHLKTASRFYEKYGGKTIVLARFMPVVRTFAPIVAGAGEMKYSHFFFFNLIGGLVWGLGMPLLGYFLGSAIPNIDQYLIPIILAIVLGSILPPIAHFLKEKHHRDQVRSVVNNLARLVTGKGK